MEPLPLGPSIRKVVLLVNIWFVLASGRNKYLAIWHFFPPPSVQSYRAHISVLSSFYFPTYCFSDINSLKNLFVFKYHMYFLVKLSQTFMEQTSHRFEEIDWIVVILHETWSPFCPQSHTKPTQFCVGLKGCYMLTLSFSGMNLSKRFSI